MEHQTNHLVAIVAAKRTPMGQFLGQFQSVSAVDLGATAVRSCLEASGLDARDVHEVLMGCVLPAGLGQAPARQVALKAELPDSVPATTLNKVCGSGMKTLMIAWDALQAEDQSVWIAGGMENMSCAPYLLPSGRSGARLGHVSSQDHMFLDGLEDAYTGKLMGSFADQTAQAMNIDREMQDEFALRSLQRAVEAQGLGVFKNEIAPVLVQTRRQQHQVTEDEGPKTAKPEKIPTLKPAFSSTGTVTAANASSISDGAAALVLTSQQRAQKKHLPVLAYMVGHATHAMAPEHFTLAPVGAIEKLLEQLSWSAAEVDLYEINEAFAMVTLLAIQKLDLDPEKVNVYGGACALGHPIGCSGARIVVTLIHALRSKGLKRGVAALCIGGGEATAIAVELP
jgi:acetyl-CoA C-acetyltransferase